MAALVHSFPQQSTTTVTMIQARPSSASGILQSTSQGQYPSNTSHMHRNSYHGINGGPTTYRGQTSMAPVAPYAFTSSPNLSANGGRIQPGSPYLRSDQRTASAPSIPTIQAPAALNRSRYPAPASVSTTSTSSSSTSDLSGGTHPNVTGDDSMVAKRAWTASRVSGPNSIVTTLTTSQQQLPINNQSSVKPSPDRYRRPVQRQNTGPPSPQQQSPTSSALPLGSGIASAGQQYNNQAAHVPMAQSYQIGGQIPQIPPMKQTGTFRPNLALRAAVDDMHLQYRQPSREEASRYRRRSLHTTDLGESSEAQLKAFSQQAQSQHSAMRSSSAGGPQNHIDPLRSSPVSSRPASSPGRSGNSDNIPSSRINHSRPSSATKREPGMSSATANPALSSPVGVEVPSFNHDQPQLVNIPPRGSSDAAKRIVNPSPLSKPMTMSPESPVSKDSFASTVSAALQPPTKATYAQVASGVRPESPAARQLAALNDKGEKKSKSSRLRRAFSFGSAAELRRAAADNSQANNVSTSAAAAAERTRLRKERYQDEREAEQARIAQRQEEGGIGQGIYSSQGNFYSGSTDNLSISSTASSASIMIRKMGQGMKKSTRSLVGLFRPKSVIGVPAAETAVSQAEVSMVTVEAERERTNINIDPHDQPGGGTGYPKLERNSIDAASASTAVEPSQVLENGVGRKSIVGGERERAEILAAVKKGILKRTGTDSGNSSPVVRPSDNKTSSFQLPPIPHINDSPISSAPSTPNDEQGHKRTGSVTLGGEDYFMSALRFRSDTKSAPGTPQGTLKRNATFSPRIQFHDTWPSGEYDRRGEIATCNRLTPMLAQQIKEELNSFKMEMEVHENSKIYTHFF